MKAIEPYDRHTEPTARKHHVCCECQGNIHAGERYHRRNGRLTDGHCWDHKTCADCEALYLRICAAVPPDCRPVIGQLGAMLRRAGIRPNGWLVTFLATQAKRRGHHKEAA